MTEVGGTGVPAWKATLAAAARASGHEMRNALNGLVVNLEVVRAATAASGIAVEPFMTQALAQSEESVRLAESAAALLAMVIGAVGDDGQLQCTGLGRNVVQIQAGESAERFVSSLAPLALRGVVSAERSGSTVILRIPEDRPEET